MAYRRELSRFVVAITAVLLAGGSSVPVPSATATANPILFVTQVPIPADFTTVVSVFGNHLGDVDSAPRGGDLMIRNPDGTLKNLTKLAGFGMDGMQGANAIAVREPSVHWSGTKALFSMVIGAPTQQFVAGDYRWQIYEVRGLGAADTPVITRVNGQPAEFNNVSPIYGSDDRIIFTSDRPRNGAAHLYPQLDEYEEAPTVSGIWSLDPVSGDLILLEHAPSGDFTPRLDSFGRLLFTRWDHLQRDQQADADAIEGEEYGTFDYDDESVNGAKKPRQEELFPEPRSSRVDLLQGTNLVGHSFNQFFPWQTNEDGEEAETLNHIGRHELHSYFDRAFTDDANVTEFIDDTSQRFNPREVQNLLQMREDPQHKGTYFAIDAPEFRTHAAGQIVSLTAPPTLPANQIAVSWLTNRATSNPLDEGASNPAHTGLYRNPLPMSDGALVAVHTAEKREERNEGTREAPRSRYDFRLKTLKKVGSEWTADELLTGGISKTVSYFDPDVLVSWSGVLWELDPVEVKATSRPARRVAPLDIPERTIFEQEGVNPDEFKRYLRDRGLALIVSRDVTTRDAADRQQPFNLKVAGSTKQSIGAAGKVYEVKFLELFQADQLRGIGGMISPRQGRRVLARPMHDEAVRNPESETLPPGSVRIAADGSLAAIVPARRAMTWQLSDANRTGVVRERYWVTFQPGEIRVCASCHGLNTVDQLGRGAPANAPEALRGMLKFYKSTLRPAPVRKRPVRH
jgi:hypothetical protein